MTVPLAASQTTEFGARLRSWRRRRKLSQLELAGEANTTPRHISFLETGRSRPRAEMVSRLAHALTLPPREHNGLLEAAGLRPIHASRPLEAPDMRPYTRVVQSLLNRHDPLPAVAVDRYGAVLYCNQAFERFSPGLRGLSPEQVIERFFGPGPGRSFIVNWQEGARQWLARQRQEAARTGDPRLESLISYAQDLIGPLPDESMIDPSPMLCTRLRVSDEILELFTAVVRFDTAQDVTLNELRIELMYPANEAAERFFKSNVD